MGNVKLHPVLNYVHDPMCSWCWAFRPILNTLLENLSGKLKVNWLLGGLAPDTDQPMTEETREYIQNHWRNIQSYVPGTKFNYDFWEKCNPRRSTYPACRAVIAARKQGIKYNQLMIEAIQTAYYLHARNPSEIDTLTELANEIGLNTVQFKYEIFSPVTQRELLNEIKQTEILEITGFPTLVFQEGQQIENIPVNYIDVRPMLEKINQLLTEHNKM